MDKWENNIFLGFLLFGLGLILGGFYYFIESFILNLRTISSQIFYLILAFLLIFAPMQILSKIYVIKNKKSIKTKDSFIIAMIPLVSSILVGLLVIIFIYPQIKDAFDSLGFIMGGTPHFIIIITLIQSLFSSAIYFFFSSWALRYYSKKYLKKLDSQVPEEDKTNRSPEIQEEIKQDKSEDFEYNKTQETEKLHKTFWDDLKE